jgi:hypothetical protein
VLTTRTSQWFLERGYKRNDDDLLRQAGAVQLSAQVAGLLKAVATPRQTSQRVYSREPIAIRSRQRYSRYHDARGEAALPSLRNEQRLVAIRGHRVIGADDFVGALARVDDVRYGTGVFFLLSNVHFLSSASAPIP